MIRFRVNGTPAPQGSKRHVGNGRMVESSKAVGPWREAVRAEAQRQPTLRGIAVADGLSVTIVFTFARPSGHYSTAKGKRNMVKPSAPKYPASKRNDLDKLTRSTFDGLVDGGLIEDDGLVVSLNCAKVYAGNGEAPGAIIEVEAM